MNYDLLLNESKVLGKESHRVRHRLFAELKKLDQSKELANRAVEELDRSIDLVKSIELAKCAVEKEFFVAVWDGKFNEVKELYDIYPDVDKVDLVNALGDEAVDRCRALHLAAHRGYFEILKFLVEHGALINVIRDDGFTPLICAATYGYDEIVAYLIHHGATIDARTKTLRRTALSYAITEVIEKNLEGYCRSVDILLKHGAETNLQDEEGYTPLMHAARSKLTTKFFDSLLESKIHPVNREVKDNQGRTVLLQVAASSAPCSLNYFKKLILLSSNVNALDEAGESVLDVMQEGTAEQNELLKNKIQLIVGSKDFLHVDIGGRALLKALKRKEKYKTRLLFECYASHIHISQDILPEALCYSYETGLFEKFIQHLKISDKNAEDMMKKHMDANGNNLLHYSISLKYDVAAEKLISICDIHAKNNQGQTPLSLACDQKNLVLAEKLVHHGANVNEKDEKGSSLIWRYLHCENTALFLLKKGADVEEESKKESCTLLIKAVRNGDKEVVSAILERSRKNIDAMDVNGQTALYIAVKFTGHIYGYDEIVLILLKAGANKNIQCRDRDFFWEEYKQRTVIELPGWCRMIQAQKIQDTPKPGRSF